MAPTWSVRFHLWNFGYQWRGIEPRAALMKSGSSTHLILVQFIVSPKRWLRGVRETAVAKLLWDVFSCCTMCHAFLVLSLCYIGESDYLNASWRLRRMPRGVSNPSRYTNKTWCKHRNKCGGWFGSSRYSIFRCPIYEFNLQHFLNSRDLWSSWPTNLKQCIELRLNCY